MGIVVHSLLHSKFLTALRPPSLAGNSLVERMRSTSFAVFGLAAAGGLALVAIFAQPGGPLLSPAPLPQEPLSSVGKARVVEQGGVPGLLGAVGRGGAGPAFSRGPVTAAHRGVSGNGSNGQAHGHGSIGSPQPVGSSPSTGGAGGQHETAPTPASVSTPAPESAPAPAPAPAPSPAPEKTSSEHSTAGSGHSAGNPGHAGSKGGEKSSGENVGSASANHSPAKESSKGQHAASPSAKGPHAALSPPPPPVAEPAVSDPPSPNPGNGKGHGYGHDK